MKNKLVAFLFLMSLPILLMTSTKEVKAEESTLNNYIYEEDFESLNVGDNGDAVYNSKKLFWFENGVTPSIIESNGSKALEYKVNNNNEYTQKEIGKMYHISRSYVSRLEKRATTKILREFIKNKRDITK